MKCILHVVTVQSKFILIGRYSIVIYRGDPPIHMIQYYFLYMFKEMRFTYNKKNSSYKKNSLTNNKFQSKEVR